MNLDDRFAAAVEIANEAAGLALNYFHRRSELVTELKGLQDYVSRADKDVETLILKRLSERFVHDATLAEETGFKGDPQAVARWVIDPIDGTTNFLRGLPHWSVCIALVVGTEIELGVIMAPVLGELYVARRGHGAQCNQQPIEVSRVDQLNRALIAFGSNRTGTERYVGTLKKLLDTGIEYRRIGCASMSLASVAAGKLDAYFEYQLAPWDALAGLLLVKEAKGAGNDFLAAQPPGPRNSLLASSAALYPELLKAFELA